ncbi:hypothetical protein ACIBI9_53705 [Nonomuraea sp. NPDC050451]|uniref:hypothetical protein n=1 Tax=Nonomuraea sp. NPDC050451 TaxID=3364364 RepID=UPI00379E755A
MVEVNRPDRQQRRATGKSDPLDSYSAAEAVLADRARAVPKSGNGVAESIRVLHLVRAGAVKDRTACLNENTAPAELHDLSAARIWALRELHKAGIITLSDKAYHRVAESTRG